MKNIDNVNHPARYETGKFECIDVMIETQGVEAVKHFCICNAFKYIYRHLGKNGLEDVKKAQWYINKYIELSENNGEVERRQESAMEELDYIRSTLSDRELLEQLAEEAAELGQAALKLIRATGVTRNPTKVDVGKASLALEKEFEDVVAVMSAFLCGYEGTWKLVDHSKKREHQMQQD